VIVTVATPAVPSAQISSVGVKLADVAVTARPTVASPVHFSKPGPEILADSAVTSPTRRVEVAAFFRVIAAVAAATAKPRGAETPSVSLPNAPTPAFRTDVENAALTAALATAVTVQVKTADAEYEDVRLMTYVPAAFGVNSRVAVEVARPAALEVTVKTFPLTVEFPTLPVALVTVALKTRPVTSARVAVAGADVSVAVTV